MSSNQTPLERYLAAIERERAAWEELRRKQGQTARPRSGNGSRSWFNAVRGAADEAQRFLESQPGALDK